MRFYSLKTVYYPVSTVNRKLVVPSIGENVLFVRCYSTLSVQIYIFIISLSRITNLAVLQSCEITPRNYKLHL